MYPGEDSTKAAGLYPYGTGKYIALKLSLFSPTYLTRENPSVASHADVLRGSSRVRQEANLSAEAVINGCSGQLKITIKG